MTPAATHTPQPARCGGLPGLTLRPYQHKLRDDAGAAFNQGHRQVLAVAPTGAGKTVTFIDIATRAIARQNRVCLLMHRGELIRQTSKALGDFPHGIIQAGHPPMRHLPLQIASVQTLVRRLDRYKFDLIIVDEAHHTTASTYMKILEAYPFARVLGVTATPIRTDGRGLRGAGYTAMVQGPTVRWLTDAGYLAPMVVYSPGGAQREAMPMRAGEYDRAALVRQSKSAIVGDVLDHYRRFAHKLPSIGFAVSVAEAERWAEEFRAAGYSAASIDGKMNDHQRARLIGALGTGELDVLWSCDLISEGVDVPVVSCIIDLAQTASKAKHKQKMGRGMRMFPGKTHGIVLDHRGNCIAHGLPDQDEEWSLDSVCKPKGEPDPDAVTVRVCAECLRSHVARPVCPFCGYVYPLQSRTVDEVAGELELLDAAYEAAGKRAEARMEEWACKSQADFEALGVKRGYQKPQQWAWHRWQAKQRKSA